MCIYIYIYMYITRFTSYTQHWTKQLGRRLSERHIWWERHPLPFPWAVDAWACKSDTAFGCSCSDWRATEEVDVWILETKGFYPPSHTSPNFSHISMHHHARGMSSPCTTSKTKRKNTPEFKTQHNTECTQQPISCIQRCPWEQCKLLPGSCWQPFQLGTPSCGQLSLDDMRCENQPQQMVPTCDPSEGSSTHLFPSTGSRGAGLPFNHWAPFACPSLGCFVLTWRCDMSCTILQT